MRFHSLFLPIFLLTSTYFSFSESVICSAPSNDVITVDQSGKGNFVTVQEAVDSIPSGNDKWTRIHVYPGIYVEKVKILSDRECIILEGSGSQVTIITGNEHDQTNASATFTALPDNFVAQYISFQNSYKNGPAVAARIYGDKSAFYKCGFLGFQDTLWAVQGRHYFESCYIEGAIDFIWGFAQSFFENCVIKATAGLLPHGVSAGYITAQGRQSASDPGGFVFKNCVVGGSGQVYLGRAYGPYSRVVFWGSKFDESVVAAGWDAWSYQGHEENFMYAEIGCQGLGADTSKRVSWDRTELSYSELEQFSKQHFIDYNRWAHS